MRKEFMILIATRKKNSVYGNPCYELLVLDTVSGGYMKGKTATNSMLGYEVNAWTWEGRKKTLEYHITKKGNVIFDRLIG